METALIIFMVFAAIVCVLAMVIVIRDLLSEKKRKKQEIREDGSGIEQDETAARESEDSQEAAASQEVVAADATTVQLDENAVVFSANAKKSLDEKFQELSSEQQRYYVDIVQYAMSQAGAKQFKNERYEEFKIRKTRIVRLQIKRGEVVCEFILLNSDFRNYIEDNKVRVRHAPTILKIEDEASLAIAKSSIDIAVKAAEEELEYRKQKRKEKRQAQRNRQVRDEENQNSPL